VARVRQVKAGKGVITLPKVGPKRLHREIDLRPAVKLVGVAFVRVNQEFGFVGYQDVKLFPEEMIEKIIRFDEPGIEIAKIKTDCFARRIHDAGAASGFLARISMAYKAFTPCAHVNKENRAAIRWCNSSRWSRPRAGCLA